MKTKLALFYSIAVAIVPSCLYVLAYCIIPTLDQHAYVSRNENAPGFIFSIEFACLVMIFLMSLPYLNRSPSPNKNGTDYSFASVASILLLAITIFVSTVSFALYSGFSGYGAGRWTAQPNLDLDILFGFILSCVLGIWNVFLLFLASCGVVMALSDMPSQSDYA